MRRLAFALPLVLVAACGGLDVVDVPLSYEIPIPSGLSGLTGTPFPGTGGEVAQTLENQGVKPGDVDSVKLTELTLTHRSPICEGLAGCDLSFVKSLKVLVSAPGLAEVEVGSITDPGAVRKVELDRADVDLAAYVAASEMTLTVQVEVDPAKRPAQQVTLGLDATMRVDVNVL